MKMSGKWWAIIGVVIFIGAVIALYIPYNNNIKEQNTLQQQINTARQMVLLQTMNKNKLEQEIQQLEEDIEAAEDENALLQQELNRKQNELEQLQDEREQAIQEAVALLHATEAKFLTAAKSIEYGELLYALADSAGVKISQIAYSSTDKVTIEEVDYGVVFLELAISGYKADILDYLIEIQADDSFATAICDSINLSWPKMLTGSQKDEVFAITLDEMIAEGIENLTVDELVNFIVLGIEDVTGNFINKRTVEDMAKAIKQLLADLMEEEFEEIPDSTLTDDYDDRLAAELAQLIKEHIKDGLEDAVVSEIVGRIVEAIENGDDLESVVGSHIATLIGSQLVSALPGDITALLKEYISECIYYRMTEYVRPLVFQDAQALTEELIEEMENASGGTVKIAVYTYNAPQEEE